MTTLTNNAEVLEKLSNKNIIVPSNVQKQVIPILKENKNVLFQSETGTGKTLAYLIPILEKIKTDSKKVQAVIVAPTHELASQIKAEVMSVSSVKVALLIGGSPIKRQIELLKEKPAIVIGGPSRLLELINLKKLNVSEVETCVFDEVDRLIAPELRDETVDLLKRMPCFAQMIACSATTKTKIISILEDALSQRKLIEGSAATDANDASRKIATNNKIEEIVLPMEDVLKSKITHWAIFAEQRDKIDTLRRFLHAEKPTKALIFTSRADQVENIAYKLQYKKVPCESLHAKSDKQKRKATIDRFRSGKCTILVTSDLSARGLDFPDVSHIIQMDLSTNDDFFVHRAGRTARAGNTGINVVIGDAHEMRIYSKLEKKFGLIVYPKEIRGERIQDIKSEQ